MFTGGPRREALADAIDFRFALPERGALGCSTTAA